MNTVYILTIALFSAFSVVVMSFDVKTANYAVNKRSIHMVISEKQPKKSWELGRFFKTASFYNALLPRFVRRVVSPVTSLKAILSPNSIIWSRSDAKGIKFGPLDDVVMGGVSKSDLTPGAEFNGIWTGFVTSENNGGFAGIRTKLLNPAFDISKCRGLTLKVKGDGNRYKFIIRDDDDWNGTAWAYSFDTTRGKSQVINIPITSFIPTKFARTVQNAGLFKVDNLSTLQLSLSKFEYDGKLNPKFTEGLFCLEIESIGTF